MTVWNEPGRRVAEDGRIVYAWPPEGRFVALWERFAGSFTEAERHDLLSLLMAWREANSTLVAYTDDHGALVDVEPDWGVVGAWLWGEVPPA